MSFFFGFSFVSISFLPVVDFDSYQIILMFDYQIIRIPFLDYRNETILVFCMKFTGLCERPERAETFFNSLLIKLVVFFDHVRFSKSNLSVLFVAFFVSLRIDVQDEAKSLFWFSPIRHV